MRKALFALVLLANLALIFAACNTTKGVGQDMKAGGDSIEKAADRNGAQH